jgi:hypothetical protein
MDGAAAARESDVNGKATNEASGRGDGAHAHVGAKLRRMERLRLGRRRRCLAWPEGELEQGEVRTPTASSA